MCIQDFLDLCDLLDKAVSFCHKYKKSCPDMGVQIKCQSRVIHIYTSLKLYMVHLQSKYNFITA